MKEEKIKGWFDREVIRISVSQEINSFHLVSTPAYVSYLVEIKSDSQADSQASVQDAPPDTPTIERKEGRTPKDDNVTLNRTGHTARDKCAEMIYTSLSYVTWANPEIIANKATSVEQLTWEEYGKKDADNSAYKNRVRTIVFNLKAKDNPALRERVVMGELAVPDFCKMSTSDMASDDLKKEWEKIQKQNLMDAQIHADNSAETDMFKCGKCKQRRTKYYQMQTRSADEPMTTFVTCLVCNNRWKFVSLGRLIVVWRLFWGDFSHSSIGLSVS